MPLWPQNTTTDEAIARTFASWQIGHLRGLGARSCAVLDRIAIRLKQTEAQAPALRATANKALPVYFSFFLILIFRRAAFLFRLRLL